MPVPDDLYTRSGGYLQRIAGGADASAGGTDTSAGGRDTSAGGRDKRVPFDLAAARTRAYAIYLMTRRGRVTTNYLNALQESLEAGAAEEWVSDIVSAYLAASHALLRNDLLADRLIEGYRLGESPRPDTDFDTALGRDALYVYVLARHFPERMARLDGDALWRLVQPVFEDRFNTLSAAYTILALGAIHRNLKARGELSPPAIAAPAADGSVEVDVAPGVFARAFLPVTVERLDISGAPPGGVYYTPSESGFDVEVPTGRVAEGIELDRVYLDADGEPAGRIRVGDELTVRLRVRSTGGRVGNVAVTDLLPGGFEIVTESVRRRYGGWFCDYLDGREDRLVYYGSFDERMVELRYRVKATSPGEFAAPAAHAAAMYHRSVRGRSGAGPAGRGEHVIAAPAQAFPRAGGAVRAPGLRVARLGPGAQAGALRGHPVLDPGDGSRRPPPQARAGAGRPLSAVHRTRRGGRGGPGGDAALRGPRLLPPPRGRPPRPGACGVDDLRATHPGRRRLDDHHATCPAAVRPGHTHGVRQARAVRPVRFDLDTRTVFGKLVQSARALQLERHYGKAEILEAYLNLAPYGGSIEGIGTASRIYFDKPASALSLGEALALAVIPQNPTDRFPVRVAGRAELLAARERLLAAWLSGAGDADPGTIARARLVPGFRSPARLPSHAPHFVRDHVPYDGGSRIRTTLDLDLQGLVEARIAEHVERRRRDGIVNAAAMLVDARRMEVLALVGSAGFFDAAIAGQVNGVRAPRSPGSTLKPLLYALALDAGLIHPMTLLEDAPRRYAAYTPENFDRGFLGPVFARDALVYSRNVPAVGLLFDLGVERFRDWLHGAGGCGGDGLATRRGLWSGPGARRQRDHRRTPVLRHRGQSPRTRGGRRVAPGGPPLVGRAGRVIGDARRPQPAAGRGLRDHGRPAGTPLPAHDAILVHPRGVAHQGVDRLPGHRHRPADGSPELSGG